MVMGVLKIMAFDSSQKDDRFSSLMLSLKVYFGANSNQTTILTI